MYRTCKKVPYQVAPFFFYFASCASRVFVLQCPSSDAGGAVLGAFLFEFTHLQGDRKGA